MFCRVGRKKPLKRSRKRIKLRGKFKAFGSNPFKHYRRKRTDDEVMQYALQCRQERLMNRTRAEMAFAELLDKHRILYEIEKIFLNGDRAIIVDFYLPSKNLAIEIDGSVHEKQRKYDAGRDRWLLETYGVKTIRLANSEVLKKSALVKLCLFGLVTQEVTLA
jgi:very-short-patch-repair endonuclease